jgi:hypothetical protein
MNQICFKTLRTGFEFSCENSSGSLFLKKSIPIFQAGSHTGENLKTKF